MRAIDRQAPALGIPGAQLMENAGSAVARVVLAENLVHRAGKVLVCCGKGNNGGDGFVAARKLKAEGVSVVCLLAGKVKDMKGDAAAAAAAWQAAGGKTIELDDDKGAERLLSDSALIVDALLGTGISGPPAGATGLLIRAIMASGRPVVSVDVPSGIDATTGQVYQPAIEAKLTVTMGAEKAGLRLYPARNHVGRVVVADIGFPTELIERNTTSFLVEVTDVSNWLPRRRADSHKGSYGTVLVVAGSRGLTGAAILCTAAAVRSGAGLVRLAAPSSLMPVLEAAQLESVKHSLPDDGRGILTPAAVEPVIALTATVQCLAVGPGIGTAEETVEFVSTLLAKAPVPVVIDADAINCLALRGGQIAARPERLVLTPHPGEFARLTGTTARSVNADRVRNARSYARAHNCVLLLKGAPTVTACPDGVVFVNSTGNSGLASGGTGDVLTGLLAGLIAQGAEPARAAAMAAFLHGRAADLSVRRESEYSLCASDVLRSLGAAFMSVVGPKPPVGE